jgi:YgiT-type zinc finger domain-containing protein
MEEKPTTTPSIDPVIPCSECQAGHMHREYIAYYTWLGDELITVPDFPAWVCDICGRCEYDENALARLSLLLSPNAGKTTNTMRKLNKKESSKPKTQRPAPSE